MRVHAIKMDGGRHYAEHHRAVAQRHPGHNPLRIHPSERTRPGGYRIQGRDEIADLAVEDAVALAAAGAFRVLLEMVLPARVAARVDRAVPVPTLRRCAGGVGRCGRTYAAEVRPGVLPGPQMR